MLDFVSGDVGKCQSMQEASAAVAVAAVGEYVQHQPVVGWMKPVLFKATVMATTRSTKGWLWVLVTLISYFQVWLSRSQAVALVRL